VHRASDEFDGSHRPSLHVDVDPEKEVLSLMEGGTLHGSVLLSIIIVNWNRSVEVARTIRYLEGLGTIRTEIVVVDNGSTDGSAEWLSREKSIRFIGLAKNYGPAKARNIGVLNCTGRYVLFLDSDAMISRSALTRLIDRMESDPTIGIAGCRILDPASHELDQWIYQYPAATHEHREFDTYSFSAAGAIVRRQALRVAGLFWEDLFIYHEEVDLSIRVLRAGYRVIYYPRARVYHARSDRGRQASSSCWRLKVRNRIWICYRYYSLVDCYVKILKFTLIYIMRGLFRGHLQDCLSGILAGLAGGGIRRRFPHKLTRDERRHIDALSRRRSLRLGPPKGSIGISGRNRRARGGGGQPGSLADRRMGVRRLFGPARGRTV
jgi:GT2 family glycosyltransferase